MEIDIVNEARENYITGIAELLLESFPHAYGDCAAEEARSIISDDMIFIAAVAEGRLVGFVGAIPQYGTTGWELHPIVIKQTHQFRGIGTKLMQALEQECLKRGGVMLYLGTDDEFGKTSLSNTDLFVETYSKMEHAVNLNKHPFEFYQKNGYKIVGVIPDANGAGKPDIIMAKRIK
jgi:aminoglycoside 6'-N-acetyltransferase I